MTGSHDPTTSQFRRHLESFVGDCTNDLPDWRSDGTAFRSIPRHISLTLIPSIAVVSGLVAVSGLPTLF